MVVLLGRWLGIFCPIYFLGGDVRPAVLSTVNLSQVSEFALVIGGIGYKQGQALKGQRLKKRDVFRSNGATRGSVECVRPEYPKMIHHDYGSKERPWIVVN